MLSFAKKIRLLAKQEIFLVFVIVTWLVSGPALFAQTVSGSVGTRAESDGAHKRAEQEVALSADKIIEILRREPGLLLVIKKHLVKEAYDQGRLLAAEDLTDEVVFNLIREDSNIRVLATQQIVDRHYVRVFPTQEELAARGRTSPETNSPATHEANQHGAGSAATSDRGRAMQKAKATNTADSNLDATESDAAEMPAINPDQLPELLAAGNSSVLKNALADDDSQQKIRVALSDPSITAALSSGLPSGVDLSNLTQGADSEAAPSPSPSQAAKSKPTAAPSRQTGPTPPAFRQRPNPYADVPSLYDLYEQVAKRPATIERFGSDIFRNGTGNFEQLPMDLPAGPEYVLGAGDGLKIDLWGSVSQRLQRVVDRSGRVSLPEVGNVLVAGHTLGEVQHEMQAVLRTQFRDVQADVSISRIRAVRVYVVGDVQRPGAYDISSLSTPLNALCVAGGPTDIGSLRVLRHYRGKELLQEVDVYDLLLHGVHTNVLPMDSGDTIMVPPIGSQVTVEGMVRRPAIYELHGENSLAEVLALAGGVLPLGTFRHIEVERLEAHVRRARLRLDIPDTNDQEAINNQLEDFKVQDGDKIRISPILSYAQKTVYLDGHVYHPGKYAYQDGMKLTDLIKSYNDLLPEPSRRHAEIIRLQPPDYTPMVIAFNLGQVLDGKTDQDIALMPFDTVRIFGRYDFEDLPVVTVNGEVRDPGDHRTNGETHLRDAVYLAGGPNADAELKDAQVFRKTNDGKLRVISVNLQKALAGDPVENIVLQPTDRVFIHRNLRKTDPPTVLIRGEVANPGKYPLGEGMTASELVQLAGGFKRSAFTETADLSRYPVQNGKRVIGDHQEVQIAKAIGGDVEADVVLRDGDVLSIRQLAGWRDIGAAVTVSGEVLHPGTYGIREGERLSSIIRRAGGFRLGAYPQGAVLEREQVREIAEKNRTRLITRLETGEGVNISKGALAAVATGGREEQTQLLSAVMRQRQEALSTLKSQSASGRLVINISSNISTWANTPADIEVRQGDTLYIPRKPSFVLVSGQVNNATAIAYTPGRNAGWYLRQAGGTAGPADKRGIFVIRANGAVVARGGTMSGWWSGSVLDTAMQPGDTIVVPEKINGGGAGLKTALNAAQVMSSLAIAARVATSF